MPLPTPNKGEPQRKFIRRCVNNPTMRREFPRGDQRVAVCYSQWRKSKKTTSDSAEEQENGDAER